MENPEAQRAWRARIDADIALLTGAGIRPFAIIRRLEDALVGIDDPDKWYEFRAPCRGKSNYRYEPGKATHVVALEFRNYKAAEVLYAQLKTLETQFHAISSLYMRHFGTDSATINLYIPAAAAAGNPTPTEA